jgi:hypothetical protein
MQNYEVVSCQDAASFFFDWGIGSCEWGSSGIGYLLLGIRDLQNPSFKESSSKDVLETINRT